MPLTSLRTSREAAARLRCSIKTLRGHVRSGALPYVALGHGRKRVRKMFADADLDAFIANQTRKDFPIASVVEGSMSELPPDEPSIAAAGADPGRRKAAAYEVDGAQS